MGIKVGFEWFTLYDLIQKMIKMSKKEGARGHFVKVVKSFHQSNPFDFHSFGLIGEGMFVKPIEEEIHVFLISVGFGGRRAKFLISKRIKSMKEVP